MVKLADKTCGALSTVFAIETHPSTFLQNATNGDIIDVKKPTLAKFVKIQPAAAFCQTVHRHLGQTKAVFVLNEKK